MDREEEKEIVELMRAARERARGYADYFGWATDRDLEEVGVVQSLAESMDSAGELFFSSIKGRGRPNDPPDCEALSSEGERIAIEVIELVDGAAIRAFKNGQVYEWAEWNKETFQSGLATAIQRKDGRYPKLKEPPYPGGYVVVVHTDEPTLNHTQVAEYLEGYRFGKPEYVTRAFLILGYEPRTQNCPYFEIHFNG
ncbi:MAG: hypothetical protein KZQ85_07405 [Candidatus Thiodiazotropha sp. (ex Myrtea sp. 'scaly one' KF741663)]|nr:hypothetical protein [Candidatus Thiodiazotropha sp. (ex Myrtea sp. 'scaly one' KF741663)]